MMRLRDAASLALSAIKGSAAKTFMTILGLGVGVGAVLTVQALGTAGERQVEIEIARMGVNRVWITAEDAAHELSGESAFLAAEATGAPVCAGACTAGPVTLNGEAAVVQIAGYDQGMPLVYDAVTLVRGRAFNAADHAQRRAVCLVDVALAESLGGDVLGCRVTAGGRRFLVVGVVESLPLPTMAVGSGALAMPLAAWTDTFGSGAQQLTINVAAGQNAGSLSERALAALGNGFRADTLESEIDAARQIVHIFVMVLKCVAIVCMMTGAIGVMNVLLIAVRQRRREIGLLKALGATAAQVGLIFMLEAAAYSLLGGMLGLLLGAGLIRACSMLIGLTAAMAAGDAIRVLISAAILGVLFGVIPALRAAGIPVVDALRSM